VGSKERCILTFSENVEKKEWLTKKYGGRERNKTWRGQGAKGIG